MQLCNLRITLLFILSLLLAGCTQAAPAPADPTVAPGAAASATAAPAVASPTQPAQASATPAPPVAVAAQLVYTRLNQQSQESELWSLALDGGQERLVLSCPDGCTIGQLAVSPDGQQVAYIATSGPGARRLRLARLDGTDDRVLVEDAGGISTAAFSPDGTHVAFLRYQRDQGMPEPVAIMVVDVAGGEPRQLSPWFWVAGAPVWLNDQQLLFSGAETADGGSVYRVALQGGAPQALAQGQLGVLAPDRSAFVVLREVGMDLASYEIVPLGQSAGPGPTWNAPLALSLAWSSAGTLALLTGAGLQFYHIGAAEVQQQLDLSFEGASSSATSILWDSAGQRLFYSVMPLELPTAELRSVDSAGQEQVLASQPGQHVLWFDLLP